MPIEINRPVTVYRMWDMDDVRQCFEAHAESGWLCSLVCYPDEDHKGKPKTVTAVWGVRLQQKRTQIAATTDQVLLSDLTTVTAMNLADYNAEYPSDQIEGA